MDSDKPFPKKDVVKAKHFSGDHRRYDKFVSYTRKSNDTLEENYQKLQK